MHIPEDIRTPILTYHHPEHQNRVDMVGMIHIAEPDYYKDIQEFVDGRASEGATVHYELMTLTRDQFAEASSAIQRKAIRMRKAADKISDMLNVEGLVRQTKAITYRDDWENHDADYIDHVAAMSQLAINSLCLGVNLTKLAERWLGKEEVQTTIFQSISDIASGKEHKPNVLGRLVTIGSDKHDVEKRNVIAMQAFDAKRRTDPAADIVLMWGAGHLKGLDQAVTQRGYVQTGERYLTAIHAR